MVGSACAATGTPSSGPTAAIAVWVDTMRSGQMVTMAYDARSEIVASAKLAAVLFIKQPPQAFKINREDLE